MKSGTLGNRYAVALADVAEKSGELERVRGELNALAGSLARERRFAIMVATPAWGRDRMKSVLQRVCRELDMSRTTARLLDYLVDKERAGLLPELAASFAEEADRRLGIVDVRLVSAVPLGDEHRRRIVEQLEGLTRSRIRLRETTDKSLIAGFQLKLGDRFFDGSLRGRLGRLKETLIHGE